MTATKEVETTEMAPEGKYAKLAEMAAIAKRLKPLYDAAIGEDGKLSFDALSKSLTDSDSRDDLLNRLTGFDDSARNRAYVESVNLREAIESQYPDLADAPREVIFAYSQLARLGAKIQAARLSEGLTLPWVQWLVETVEPHLGKVAPILAMI